MQVSESWVVYSYWSAVAHRTEMSTLSLYEGMIDKYGLSPFNRVSSSCALFFKPRVHREAGTESGQMAGAHAAWVPPSYSLAGSLHRIFEVLCRVGLRARQSTVDPYICGIWSVHASPFVLGPQASSKIHAPSKNPPRSC